MLLIHKFPPVTFTRLGLGLAILVLVISGCLKKKDYKPSDTEVLSTDIVFEDSTADTATPVAREGESSDSEESKDDNETATEKIDDVLISVRLPGEKNSPEQFSLIDTEGNMILPFVAHEVIKRIDVGVVTPPFDSQYFFEYCDFWSQRICGIITSKGKVIVDLDDSPPGSDTGSGGRETSWVSGTTVLKNGKFFFHMFYDGSYPATSYIPGVPEWESEWENEPEGCGDRLKNPNGELILDSEISRLTRGEKVLVRYPRRTVCSDNRSEAAPAFHDSEICELVSLPDNKKLNKVELKACLGEMHDLFPVMPVDSGGLWGYMNPEGEMVIPAIFHWAGYFHDGKTIVKISLSHAKEICAKTKKSPSPANEAILAACAKGFSAWEKTEQLCSMDPDVIKSKLNNPSFARKALQCMACVDDTFDSHDFMGKCSWTNSWTNKGFADTGWTIIDKKGQIIDRFDYDVSEIYVNTENARMIFSDGNYLDVTILPVYAEAVAKQYGYDCISKFYGNVAFVQKNYSDGLVDKNMQEVLPPQYRVVSGHGRDCNDLRFFHDIAAVEKNGLLGYINSQGKLITPIQYGDRSDYEFNEGSARVYRNALWGYINSKGKEITPIQYEDAREFRNGFAPVKRNGLWGYINEQGKEITPIQYEDAREFYRGFAFVERNGLRGYINEQGKEITPIQYEVLDYFQHGFARAKRNGLWGYINEQGKEITPIQYENVEDFQRGFARVKQNGLWRFIDTNGNEVTHTPDEVGEFFDGLALIMRDGLYGYIDAEGNEIIKPKFEEAAKRFYANRAIIKQDGKCGYIDLKGNIVTKPQWDGCEDYSTASETALVYNIIKGEKEYAHIYKNGTVVPEEYCLAPNPRYPDSDFARTFVRCRKLDNNFHALETEERRFEVYSLNELNTAPPNANIHWKENPKGGYSLVNALGENLAPYRIKIRPTKTRSGLSAFEAFGNVRDNWDEPYLGWINANGKILWPPNWNDPCTDTNGIVIWPEGSCMSK